MFDQRRTESQSIFRIKLLKHYGIKLIARFNIKYFHIFIYIGFQCDILMFNSVMKHYTIYVEF